MSSNNQKNEFPLDIGRYSRRDVIKGGLGLAGMLAFGEAPGIIVKSMAGMRQGMVSSESLPYDAEVQYIESNGTQYIDTGVIPKNTIGARMLLLVKGNHNDRIILMAGGDSVG